MTAPMTCFCGQDCSSCLIYLATVGNDDALRRRSQRFYRDEFGFDIPLEKFRCLGGRSDELFYLCKGCPWMKCAKDRGLTSCSGCADHPCGPLAEYRDRYVNRCNISGL